MRCTACEKNEAHSAVICDSCRTHYAAIREGHYAERVVAVGELNLAARSWVAVGAPIEKQKRRDEKAPKAKGSGPSWMKLMPGKAAEVPVAPVEEEAPPPPDWKNRVFPVPDADDAPVSAPAAETEAPVQETTDGMSYGAETEFSYGTGQLDEQQVLDLTAPAQEEPAPIELTPVEPEAAVIDLAPAVEVAEVEEEPIAMSLESSVPQAVEPVAPVVEEPPAQAPELSNFFESLAAPTETPEPVVEEAAPAPAPELSSFFESLTAPAAPEPVVETAPEPEAPAPIQADLANFFDSLSAPAEAAPAPEAPAAEAPAAPAADLSSFFDSLTAPAAPAPEPVAEAAPEAPEAPAALSNFFDSLSAPAPAEAPTPEVASAPQVEAAPDLSSFFDTLSAPAPQAEPAASEPVAESPIVDFFESLSAPAPTPEAASTFEAPAPAFEIAVPPTAAVSEASSEKKPFSIELDLSMTPGSSQTGAGGQRQAGELKPPTHGQPFSIDLGGGEPKSTTTPKKSNTAELKRQHSTAGAGFDLVAEDDDEAGTGNLFEGISFGGSAHDDDDDERTIEL